MMAIESALLFLVFIVLFGSILSGIPAWLAIGGAPLLVSLCGIALGVFDPSFLSAYPQRVFGMMGNQFFIAIPLFILMGVMLEKTGLARDMLLAVETVGGKSRRQVAISVLAISTLIAASTGIAGATIVMLGMISYPSLVRAGVPQSVSSGLVISAGTLGQIIPPSIVLIVLADQVSNAWQQAQRAGGSFSVEPVTVNELFAAAFFPGLLLALLYALYLFFVLGARKTAIAEPDPSNTESKPGAFALLLPLVLIVAVLGSILSGIATATEAAAIGASGSIALAGLKFAKKSGDKTLQGLCLFGAVCFFGIFVLGGIIDTDSVTGAAVMTVLFCGAMGGLAASVWLIQKERMLLPSLIETTRFAGVIFAIVMGASLLSLIFRGLGGDEAFAAFTAALPGEKWTALLLVLLVVFVLGFVLEFIEITFIIVPIAGPVLFAMGIDPIWFAVLLAVNLQTSFLTPPMGVALFYFRSVVPKGLSMSVIYRGIVPFILLQLLALGVVFLFPQFALFLPQWLFR